MITIPWGLLCNVFVVGWCAGIIVVELLPGTAAPIWTMAIVLCANLIFFVAALIWKKQRSQHHDHF